MQAISISIPPPPQALCPSRPVEQGEQGVDLSTAMKLLEAPCSLPREVAWTYDAGSPVTARQLGPDGTIYVGTDAGALHAVRPDGSQAWQRDVGGRISGGLAVGPDGTIYAGTEKGDLLAFDPQGHAKWHIGMARIDAAPCVSPDGMVYAGDGKGLHAIDPAGRELWAVPTPDPVMATPVVTPRGHVVAADLRSRVYGVDSSTGRVAWMKQLSGAVLAGAPVRAMDGLVWVTYLSRDMRNDEMAGLDENTGAPARLVPLRDTIHLHATPDASGDLYLSCNDGGAGGSLQALSPEGRVVWKTSTKIPLETSPCRTRDGAVVARDARGVVHAFDAKSGALLWSQDPTDPKAPYRHGTGECLEGPDGALYTDDKATRLVALRVPLTLEERARRRADEPSTTASDSPRIQIGDDWIVVGGVRVPVRHQAAATPRNDMPACARPAAESLSGGAGVLGRSSRCDGAW